MDAPKAPKCSVCNDSSTENDSIEKIHDTLICADCLKTVVERSADGRDRFPPMINRRQLGEGIRAIELSNILGCALFKKYAEAMRASKVVPIDRIYCQCGTFLAKRLELVRHDISSAVCECYSVFCDRLICRVCSTMIEAADTGDDHDCAEKVKAHEAAQRQLRIAKERGAEYQIYPNQDCKRVISL